MNVAAKPHSLAQDALAVITGLGFLAFSAVLLAWAFWLRHGYPIWDAL